MRPHFLCLFLAIILLSPCFASEYIIVPGDGQDSILSAFSSGGTGEGSMPALRPIYGTEDYAASLTEEQAGLLTAQGFRLYPNLEIHAFLNESVPQINADDVWSVQVNGTNLTGAGQTICLLDSGIDENNTAFGNGWDNGTNNGTILEGWAFFNESGTYYNQACNATNHTACFDDAGHGTSMAGVLISQNSTFRGVAYNSKLVIVKVLDSGGFGVMGDLAQGINYCISRAAEYNISVISMSLGTIPKSNSYCDNETWVYSGVVTAINNAVALNISVIAASGNSNVSTNISSPACIFNATPVAAVNKSDAIYGYDPSDISGSDYWALPILFAPGVDVYSATKGGGMGYFGEGTSYSAAHVAGVFALMKQYIAARGLNRTSQYLEDGAVLTGLKLNITSNHNQSRIDAFNLYEYLSGVLYISITSPPNSYVQNNTLLTVIGISYQDNTTISVYNSTGSLITSNQTNETSWSVDFTLADGTYNITAVVSNGTETANTSIGNITIDTVYPLLNITSPSSNGNVLGLTVTINLTVAEAHLNYTNISIRNSTGDVVNSTVSTSLGNFSVSLSAPVYGAYSINATTYDWAGNYNISSVSNFTFISSATLKIRPNWTATNYQGNSTISAGGAENSTTTRMLYFNLNQTKMLVFYVNNSGTQELLNVLASSYGFAGLNASLSWADGWNISLPRNVSAGSAPALNLTIINSNSSGNYNGTIYIDSANGGPYTYLNLTLNLAVVNQTLQSANSTGSRFLSNETNLTDLGFRIYLYDNQTLDTYWNGSYPVNLTNATNTTQLTFNVSGGLFYTQINTTNLSEGNYSLVGNFNDTLNNTVQMNLSITLLKNIVVNITITNENSIIKDVGFTFTVNVTKPGSVAFGNGTVCISLPSGITNTSGICKNITNLNAGATASNSWTLNGTARGNYTVNATTISNNTWFNKTDQKNLTVKYGELYLQFTDSNDDPPSSVDASETFYVSVRVTNRGDINATGVSLNLDFESTYFTLESGSDPRDAGVLEPGESDTYSWTMKARTTQGVNRAIAITATGGNATSHDIDRDVDVVVPSGEDGGDGGGSGNTGTNTTPTGRAGLTFTKPVISNVSIYQGQTLTTTVSLRNSGTLNLTNLYLEVSGIDPSVYRIDSNSKAGLAIAATRDLNLVFIIPLDLAAKKYNLTLRAVSDQSSWTHPYSVEVISSSVRVDGLNEMSIVQGESGTYSFSVKNTGKRTFNNLKPGIDNVPQESYSITPQNISILSPDLSQSYTLVYSVPAGEPIGTKNLTLSILTDEGKFTHKVTLKVLPGESERDSILRAYNELLRRFQLILAKFAKLDPYKNNVSEIEQMINDTQHKLDLVNSSLEDEDYASARNYINETESIVTELENRTSSVKGSTNSLGSVFMTAILLIAALLIAIAVFYYFISRKGSGVRRYIIAPKAVQAPGEGKKSFLVLGGKKTKQELQREKMLEEWRKRYELSKKKEVYGK